MPRLTTREFVEALCFGDKMFRTLKGVAPNRGHSGRINFVTGRHSILLDAAVQNRRFGIKCYTLPQPHLGEVCTTLSSLHNNIIIHPTALPQELWVGDRHIDIALYPWVEGHTLDWEIRKALHDGNSPHLRHLLGSFCRLSERLLEGEWRHGDLKCENIIVRPDGEMIMVDCDALYHPTLPFRGEVGTPPFIHPARGEAYDDHIDDYAIALITTSLGALATNPRLAVTECMVAAPSEHKTGEIARALKHDEHLLHLLDALHSSDYKINDLKHILKCIIRR